MGRASLQVLVAAELLGRCAVVEVPAGVDLRVVAPPPAADAPAPASEADESYRLIPLG